MTVAVLAWAMSLAVLGPPSSSDQHPQACAVVWSGYVVEGDTDEGIPNASLSYMVAGEDPRFLRTDSEGGFRIEGLCPGNLEVRVSKAEHSTLDLEVELAGPSTESMLELEALHDHHSSRVIVVHDEGQPTTSASESLSGAELDRTRGQGLADAISGMAGVSVLRGPAGGMGKPIIRGHLGRRTLILVDGVRHEGQEWGLDHAPEVDPNAAGRITVIKGAGTTRYGSEANGGVVLLESRPLLRRPGVGGEVLGFGHSNALGGGGSARLDYAPTRAKGLTMRVEGNVARHRAALTPDYPLDNTGALTWNAGARIGYLSDPADVEVGYRVMRSQLGICTCLQIASADQFTLGLAARDPVGVDLYSPEFAIERPRQEIWHHLARVRSRVPVEAAGELHLSYSFQFNDRREFEVVRSNVTGPQLELGLATHLAEVDLEHAALRMGEWTLVGTVGVVGGQQRNQYEGASTLVPDYEQWNWSVYDVERFVHDRVEIELGVRYDGASRAADLTQRDYSGQAAGDRLDEARCRVDAGVNGGGLCTVVFHAPSATIGVLARPLRQVPELSWRTQLDSAARMPAIDEQFMNGAAPSFPILGFGSSKIGVERTWGGETTLRYEGDWLTVEGSGYASWIDDYIAFVPEPQTGQCAPLTCTTRGAFPVFVFEATDALFAGGELRFELLAPRLPLGLSGTASWVRARDLDGQRFLPLIPADRYSLAGRWFWPDTPVSSRGYLEINGTLVARQSRVDPGLDFAGPPPAYVLLGAGLGLEFQSGGQGDPLVRASLIGTNLLNMRYREYTSLLRYFADEPGWGLQLRVGVEFDVGA